MRVILARVAWLQGFPEKAAAIAKEAADIAAGDSAFSVPLCLAIGAIPVALWNGDDALAEVMVGELAERASRYSLSVLAKLGGRVQVRVAPPRGNGRRTSTAD